MHSNNGSPEGAKQLVAVLRSLIDEHLSGVETEPPGAALSGLSAFWNLNPGLAPWAVLLDPFEIRGYAPEAESLRQKLRGMDHPECV